MELVNAERSREAVTRRWSAGGLPAMVGSMALVSIELTREAVTMALVSRTGLHCFAWRIKASGDLPDQKGSGGLPGQRNS